MIRHRKQSRTFEIELTKVSLWAIFLHHIKWMVYIVDAIDGHVHRSQDTKNQNDCENKDWNHKTYDLHTSGPFFVVVDALEEM